MSTNVLVFSLLYFKDCNRTLYIERDTGQRARIGRDARQENRVPVDRQQLGCAEAEGPAGARS